MKQKTIENIKSNQRKTKYFDNFLYFNLHIIKSKNYPFLKNKDKKMEKKN